MKRFLILLILIVFVTVSCAGPNVNRVVGTKPDFRQDQFEKDREDCIQSVKDDPEQKMTAEECLAKKGYESESSSDKEKAKTAEAAKTVGKVLLITAFVAVVVAAAAAYVVLLALAGGH